MNCRATEALILAERDGVLTTDQHAALGEHVATCPACRLWRKQLNEAIELMQMDAAKIALPNIDEEWRTIRAHLHGAETKPQKKGPLAPIVWFGAPLAAAAAVALVFFIKHPAAINLGESLQVADVASAEFVEAGNAKASTMVYVDKDSGWLVVWASDNETERSS